MPVYKDTAPNRKLGRVGKAYGKSAKTGAAKPVPAPRRKAVAGARITLSTMGGPVARPRPAASLTTPLMKHLRARAEKEGRISLLPHKFDKFLSKKIYGFGEEYYNPKGHIFYRSKHPKFIKEFDAYEKEKRESPEGVANAKRLAAKHLAYFRSKDMSGMRGNIR